MIYYIIDKQVFLDFHSLLLLTNTNKSNLYRMIKKTKISNVKYKNTFLYKYDDISKILTS